MALARHDSFDLLAISLCLAFKRAHDSLGRRSNSTKCGARLQRQVRAHFLSLQPPDSFWAS
jgi:hypothetical protein